MTLQQITAKDIAGWDSLDDIASSFEKRGLKPRHNLGDENELVLQLTDTEFIVIVEAGPGESATDFKPDNRNRRTNLVATNDFEEFHLPDPDPQLGGPTARADQAPEALVHERADDERER